MKFFRSQINIATISVITILAVALLACQEEKKFRIGVSQCSSDDWRNKMNEEIMREAIFHNNVEIEIRSAEDCSEKQIADIEYFVENGFDIIAVAPNEADALTPIVSQVFESGMPIVLFDRHVNGNRFTAYQGADNEEIGRFAARMALHLGGENSKVIEIRGLDGSSPELYRHKGFKEEAAEIGLDIVGSGYGDWNAEKGGVIADSLLRAFPEASVVYAHNDRMAIASSKAAEKLGRKMRIIGIDAAPHIGIQAVKDSVIDATFLYPTQGAQLVRTALAILENKPYEKYLILPSPAAVDASNAELLMLQDNTLRDETDKIEKLKSQLDAYWQRHSSQTTILYGAILILILSIIIIFLLVRAYWIHKRNRSQTERRNAELARQKDELAKQKDELQNLYECLQEATSSKLTFFTNVSHDLRTPLSLIAEPVNLLAEADNLTPKQRIQMQLADKNVKRLMRLINQILDIRKYDNSRLGINLVNVDFAEALRDWCASFTQVAVKQHIGFSTDIPVSDEFTMAVDVEKMERVLFNLLSNAFKFTPSNGHITVALRKEGSTAVLTVSDSGCGIPADDINNVFDRFFKTERINPTGSGIGLALTKIFVEMHGGTITVRSELGIGTEFEVRLPIRIEEGPKADISVSVAKAEYDTEELVPVIDDPEAPVSEDAPTVLVIDDNSDVRTLIKSILGDRYTVLQASSGAQGIRVASKYIPDLIICDVMMPEIDGYETCRQLKNEVLTSHIPVLLLTACSQDEQRIEGYSSGADGYMSKPFDSRMLIARCEALIENHKRVLDATSSDVLRLDASVKSVQRPDSDIDSEFHQRFVSIVNEEMGNSELSVEELAARLGLSRVQMYRKIKALTNYSPAELIRNIRLQRAAVLLKTSEATVSEVAYAVGFTAPNYFTKCYRQYFGELPTETQQRTSKKT